MLVAEQQRQLLQGRPSHFVSLRDEPHVEVSLGERVWASFFSSGVERNSNLKRRLRGEKWARFICIFKSHSLPKLQGRICSLTISVILLEQTSQNYCRHRALQPRSRRVSYASFRRYHGLDSLIMVNVDDVPHLRLHLYHSSGTHHVSNKLQRNCALWRRV